MTSANPFTPDSALQELKEGNQRFMDNKLRLHYHKEKARRAKLASIGQTPLAAILTCSDSRVPSELLFDQGFGDLFIVRVAGNILGETEVGSLEYAVEHLGVPLVVVMGHTKCGAVLAAVDGFEAPGALGWLLERLKPAALSVANLPDDQKGEAAIMKNVELAVSRLTSISPVMANAVREGRAKVIGAMCHIEDGRVVFH